MNPIPAYLLSAASLLVAASGVAAQACLGLPSRDGQVAVSLTYAPVNDDVELGGEFHADVSGPAAFGFGYRTVDGSDQDTFLGRIAYDFFLLEPAVCAVGGVEFSREIESGPDERLAVPLGIGIGKTLRLGLARTTLYVLPRYAWVREVRAALAEETVETSHAFLGEAGVTLGLRLFHVGGALLTSSLDGDEPVFRLRAGFQF